MPLYTRLYLKAGTRGQERYRFIRTRTAQATAPSAVQRDRLKYQTLSHLSRMIEERGPGGAALHTYIYILSIALHTTHNAQLTTTRHKTPRRTSVTHTHGTSTGPSTTGERPELAAESRVGTSSATGSRNRSVAPPPRRALPGWSGAHLPPPPGKSFLVEDPEHRARSEGHSAQMQVS